MNNDLKSIDPIKRQVEVSAKDRGTEFSPMSPPEAYNPPCDIKVDYEQFHQGLKQLVDEHTELKANLLTLENALKRLQKNSGLALELNSEIQKMLESITRDFSEHNKKEEKYLFPLLAKRFLEIGEHSKARNPITPINILEDEHIEATQLLNEVQYIWSLVFRVNEPATLRLLLKDFLVKSLKIIEVTRLHIFREDDIVFSLAQRNLTTEELDSIFSNF